MPVMDEYTASWEILKWEEEIGNGKVGMRSVERELKADDSEKRTEYGSQKPEDRI